EEVSRLAAASHFGELSGADATRLNYLLETSDLARRVFLRAAQETHDLRQWATEYPLRSAVDAGKDAMRSGWIAQRANQFREAWAKPGIAFRHCLAASLLLIVGVVGYYWRPGRLDDSLGQENVV